MCFLNLNLTFSLIFLTGDGETWGKVISFPVLVKPVYYVLFEYELLIG